MTSNAAMKEKKEGKERKKEKKREQGVRSSDFIKNRLPFERRKKSPALFSLFSRYERWLSARKS